MAYLNEIESELEAAFAADGFIHSPNIEGLRTGQFFYQFGAIEWAVPLHIYRQELLVAYRGETLTPNVQAWINKHAKTFSTEKEEPDLNYLSARVDFSKINEI